MLGLLLPYTPLHHLLLEACGAPLVMTSANVSDEPICSDNEEARERLAKIADAFLWHDRAIATRCDDSVSRVIAGIPTLLRRSRGLVPRPIRLAHPVSQPILACGAQQKNTFCIAVEDTAYFGPHIGDLESVAAFEFYEEAVERMQRILGVWPEIVAHDRHPGYLSTRYALARSDATRVGVQHHHAHVASAIAEHSVAGPVLGVAYDGTGSGDDGTSWGGEFLLSTAQEFERLATFRPLPLAGGDIAMREIWRTAYGLLHDAFEGEPPIERLPLFRDVPERSIRVVSRMIEHGVNTPAVRGVGRYFDAFGALVLGRSTASYEAQIAMALEAAADSAESKPYPFAIERGSAPMEIDLRPTTRAVVEDLVSGVDPGRIAARFHDTIIALTADMIDRLLERIGSVPVALTGGVFQNARLARGVTAALSDGIELLRHREVPPGDGGIALGQALVADATRGGFPCA
jgi:hydrogenase maturation protein HypF